MNNNRSRYEVIASILMSCSTKEQTHTRIMCKSMLSHGQCKSHIQLLLKCGLIVQVLDGEKICYDITETGNRFLLNFEEMKKILPSILSKSDDQEIKNHSLFC